MSLIFSCRNYSNTLCGTVVVYSGFQNILWAILVIGMFWQCDRTFSNFALWVVEYFRQEKMVSKIFCWKFWCRKFSIADCRTFSIADESICRKFSVVNCMFSPPIMAKGTSTFRNVNYYISKWSILGNLEVP